MEAYHSDPAGMALVIKQCILEGVDTIPSLIGKTVTGGRLNIYKAALLMPDLQLSVSIQADNETICEGENVQLSAQVTGGTGNLTYSWTSDPAGFTSTDPVVTVEPTISTSYFLEVFDNENIAASDSILITVNLLPGKPAIAGGPLTVDNFTSTSSSYTCSESANAVSYQWTVSPAGAGTCSGNGTEGSVLWANSFTGIATITVAGINDCDTSEFSDAFTTEVYTSAGLNENQENGVFTVYPNPAKDVIHFMFISQQSAVSGQQSVGQLGNWQLDNMKVEIYDISGISVKSQYWPAGSNELVIDLEMVNPGIYTAILINDGKFLSVEKFIISK
jgi:hypothetical protein